ncbi:hypothetical protein SJI19_19375 [Acerihabitans sp. TG2]|uniref:hypothetical protein n=1 Tax=Acerihabitans sp. TG2 TaxID=3096008 RepID=UPI002B2394C3|nr:hypothetical protein [Acerihabitans sp. TG2]MEA9392669.1 hypothetical protein [Acerihabitans sp. TG2]
MKLTSDTQEILRHYKAVVNASRRESELPTRNTTQILDEICSYMKCQSAVFICGVFIQQPGRKSDDK